MSDIWMVQLWILNIKMPVFRSLLYSGYDLHNKTVPHLDKFPSREVHNSDSTFVNIWVKVLICVFSVCTFSLSILAFHIFWTRQKTRTVTKPESHSELKLPFELQNLEKGDSQSMQALEDFLSTRSYIEGFEPTTSDNLVFEAVDKKTEVKSGGDLFPNLRRWHQHIQSFGNERKKFLVNQ